MLTEADKKLVNDLRIQYWVSYESYTISQPQLASLLAKVREDERIRCGEVANRNAAIVEAQNTYRGSVNDAASFAIDMLEDVGMQIRSLK